MDHELTRSTGFLCLGFKTQLKAYLSPSRDESWLEAELELGLQVGADWEAFERARCFKYTSYHFVLSVSCWPCMKHSLWMEKHFQEALYRGNKFLPFEL